jgi:hypothetical protein
MYNQSRGWPTFITACSVKGPSEGSQAGSIHTVSGSTNQDHIPEQQAGLLGIFYLVPKQEGLCET